MQKLGYIQLRILLRKKGTNDIFNNMGEFQKHDTIWKKIYRNDCVLYDSLIWKYRKVKTIVTNADQWSPGVWVKERGPIVDRQAEDLRFSCVW